MGYQLTGVYIRPNGTEQKIRPTGWQPTANTVAYRPLTSRTTVNDQSGNSNTLTNAGVNFTTYNGVSCARITGNADDYHNADKYLYGNITGLPTGANARTFSRWMYQDNAASSQDACYLWQGQASNNKAILLAQGVDASGDIFISQYGASSSSLSPIIGQRHNNVLVYDGSKFVYYVNAVEEISWTYIINTGSTKFSLGGASENGAWNSFNGGFSNVIIEDVAWSQQDVTDYFTLMKGNYGIS